LFLMLRLTMPSAILAGLLLLGAGPGPAQPAPSTAPKVAPERRQYFDSAWTEYYGPEYCVYLAVRDPGVEGPLMRRLEADAPAGSARVQDVVAPVQQFLRQARKEKIVDRHLSELVTAGFAVGVNPGDGKTSADGKREPGVLFVLPRNDKLARFCGWLVEQYRKDKGADSTAAATVEGFGGTRFLKSGEAQPVLVLADKVALLANQESLIADALKRARSPKETLAGTRAYTRVRPKVAQGAAAFLVVDIARLVDLIKGATKNNPENARNFDHARASLEPIAGLLVQVSADKSATHAEMTVAIDPASPGYDKLRKLAPTRGVKAASLVAASTPAFLSLLRPADLAASIQAGQKEEFADKLLSLKGYLQTQTSLEFDKDVAPWWGQELAIALDAPDDSPPEAALLVESTDAKACQAAVAKVVRHVGVTQNRTFGELQAGDTKFQVAKPGQYQTPFNWALGVVSGYAALGTGSRILAAAAGSDKKLSRTEPYKRLVGTFGADRLALAMVLKSDLLVRSLTVPPPGQQPGPPVVNPEVKRFSEEVESVVLGLGWVDPETVRVTLLFNGRAPGGPIR
jgi:hypothetical protein